MLPTTPPTTTTTVVMRPGGRLLMGPRGTLGPVGPYTSAPKSSWSFLGPMPSSLAPTSTSNLPKVALLHHIGLDHRRFLVLRFPVGIFYTKRPVLQSS